MFQQSYDPLGNVFLSTLAAALTRALLFASDKEIILLDESTSSVDPKNEEIIYRNILAHFKDKTIIASIHKMNLLPLFDRVLEFENGALFAKIS